MYVIKKGDLYAAPPGDAHSYTTLLQKARIFRTKEDAKKEQCGNEYVVPLESELTGLCFEEQS